MELLEKIVDKTFEAIDSIPLLPNYSVGNAREDTALIFYIAKYIVIDLPVEQIKKGYDQLKWYD